MKIKEMMESDKKKRQLEIDELRKKERENEMRRKIQRREMERASQLPLHVHHLPRVHKCPMAASEDMVLHGSPRRHQRRCLLHGVDCNHMPFRTCEACDFDACDSCVHLYSLPTKDRQQKEQQFRDRARAAKDNERRRREEANLARVRDIMQMQHIPEKFRQPPAVNRNRQKLLKYVVWTSDGYDPDGFHGYMGPPPIEFDSSFDSVEDANSRVCFRFYVQNAYGVSVEEMLEEDIQQRKRDGLLHLEVCPADSTRFKVAAVPSAAFKHLQSC